MIRGNTSDFIGHPLPKGSISDPDMGPPTTPEARAPHHLNPALYFGEGRRKRILKTIFYNGIRVTTSHPRDIRQVIASSADCKHSSPTPSFCDAITQNFQTSFRSFVQSLVLWSLSLCDGVCCENHWTSLRKSDKNNHLGWHWPAFKQDLAL